MLLNSKGYNFSELSSPGWISYYDIQSEHGEKFKEIHTVLQFFKGLQLFLKEPLAEVEIVEETQI